jgi:hypothetical protein
LKGPLADGAFISINHPTSTDDERCTARRRAF